MELMNEMGISTSSSLFCVKRAAYKKYVEKVYNMKSLSKYGDINAGASTIDFLILIKASF